MANDSLVAWVVEHLLKLVELFVVVPVALVAAALAFVVVGPWILVCMVVGDGVVPAPPEALVAVVEWPYSALEHVFTGDGGFHWTPT